MTIARLSALLAAAALAAACTPEEGPSMRPGSDCLGCHGDPGAEEDGPPWTIAGTVYASPQGTGAGVRGAAVVVTDATGRTVTLHSQEVGNFYLADGLAFPLQVTVERNGVAHVGHAVTGASPETSAPLQAGEGSCNRCHRAGTAVGAISAP